METQENKYIHLVYEKWDDENNQYFPNIFPLTGEYEFGYEPGFLDFYQRFYRAQLNYNKDALPFKSIHIDNVNDDGKKYYYFLKTSRDIGSIFENLELSEKVKYLINNNNNFFIVLLREHEADWYNSFLTLYKYVNKNNLKADKFIIISNNAAVEKYNFNFKHYKLNLISMTASSIFNELVSNFVVDKKGKFFLCHNRTGKLHRYSLLSSLEIENIIEDVNWSLNPTTNIITGKNNLIEIFDKDYISKYEHIFDKFFSIKIKESDFEKNKNFYKETGEIDLSSINTKLGGAGGESGGLMIPELNETYENSFFNLVTESHFQDFFKTIHITEKSLRPFYFYQFPLILSTHGHIKYMRKEFKLDFFDDIINHSYDEEFDQKIRFNKFIEEVKRINSNKDFYKDFYIKNFDRFEANKKIIQNLPNDTRDFNFLRSLMS